MPLPDALRLLELMATQGDCRYHRGAVRCLARLAAEAPGVRLTDLELAARALAGLSMDSATNLKVLAALLERPGVAGARAADPGQRPAVRLPPK